MALMKKSDWTNLPEMIDEFFHKDWFDLNPLTSLGTRTPAVNIKEEDNAYIFEVAVPGMKKDDFQIHVEDDMLSISSEQEEKKEEKDEAGKYTRREFRYTSFKRSFNLPKNADQEKIAANYADGVLAINIPKKAPDPDKPAKKIDIQ